MERNETGKLGKTKANGITLIALVVTIVVLIILATISINAVFGKNGIIKRAEAAKRLHEQGITDEQEGLNSLNKYLGDKLNGVPEMPVTPDTPKGPNGKPLVNKDTVNKTEHDKIVGEDKLGNPVVVPNGFKVPEESGDNVEDGIIIEDATGNQFVWVPVSNIDGDGIVNNQSASGLIIKKDGSKVQITLGRYSFSTTSSTTTTLVQKGSEYSVETSNSIERYKIQGYDKAYYHYEMSVFRESNYDSGTTGVNTTFYNLKGFIESVERNKGYFIARYEASYGSGNNVETYKPLSQKSERCSDTNMNTNEEKTLWNYITQGDASKVSRNMYAGNEYVTSDLANSYMWDTTIVYIQAMGNENYANQIDGNGMLKNTGSTKDEKCQIFDMSGNLQEWTTEYCVPSDTPGTISYPSTYRGGLYNVNVADYNTAYRNGYQASYNGGAYTGFRIGIYIK